MTILDKVEKLVDSMERSVSAWERVALILEKKFAAECPDVVIPDATIPGVEKPPRKPRGPNKKATETPAAPIAPAPIPAEVAGLTEEQSALEATATGKALVQRFNRLTAVGPDGQPAPEGYQIAKELLAQFKVARLADLVHAQRLQFIAAAKARIAAGDATAPAPAPAPSSVGIGV